MRALSLASLVLALAPNATADILTPAEVLRVRFTIDNSWTTGSPPDVIRLNFGIIQVNSAFGMRSAALYDGDALLGVDVKTSFGGHVGALSLSPSNAWADPTSVWVFKNPVQIDFTSILDGTIEGRVDFTIASGEMDIPLSQVTLSMIRGTGTSSGTPTNPAPTITSVEIVGDVGTSFCTAVPNSTGMPASIAGTGSSSVALNDLVLHAGPVPVGQPGIFYYGPDEVQVPFGDGFRCVGGPLGTIERLFPFVQPDANGSMIYAVNNTLPNHAPQLTLVGATWKFQAWYRDPDALAAGFNLSDGLSLMLRP